jgi:hydrogenase maturation protein HypF
MWRALLADLAAAVAPATIAARFHNGLVDAIVALVQALARQRHAVSAPVFDTVALSGGCWQNKILLEATLQRLAACGYRCLSHARVPANDGGLALGQAAVAAARHLSGPD